MSLITEPLQYSFMQSAFVAAILIGMTCATLGVYVVLRRMAFIGDALAHTALPGLVVAYLNGWSLFGGAIVAGLLTALGIGWLSRRSEVREDTAIGILFTGMFALGILLISTTRSFRDLTHILFGNILGVTSNDLLLIAGITVITISSLFIFHKEMELTSFDPTYAEVIGLKADRIRYLLLILLSLTVVTSIQVVGVVLTSAMLVTPAAAAALLSNSLTRMMIISAVIAVASSIVGLYISFYQSVSSGAAIVLVATICFGMSWLVRLLKTRIQSKSRL